MKKITLLLLMLISGTIFGQTTDTNAVTTANAAIVQALLIEKTSDLEFGTLIPEYSTPTDWTIYSDGTTPDGTATKFSGSVPQTAAAYTITSEATQSYTVTIPATITLNGPTQTMLVTLESNLGDPGTGVISHSSTTGSYDLVIGGTLDISANQEPGPYTTDFNVTVAYE